MPIASRPALVAGLAVLALVAGCALRGEDPPDAPGRPVDAIAGQRFTLDLESNASTGYRWYLEGTPNPNVVRVISSEYRPSDRPLAGAPGSERWVFEAVAPGTTTLAFAYRRPWADDAEPAERRRYTVRVRAKS